MLRHVPQVEELRRELHAAKERAAALAQAMAAADAAAAARAASLAADVAALTSERDQLAVTLETAHNAAAAAAAANRGAGVAGDDGSAHAIVHVAGPTAEQQAFMTRMAERLEALEAEHRWACRRVV
jgi:hypothetical protein